MDEGFIIIVGVVLFTIIYTIISIIELYINTYMCKKVSRLLSTAIEKNTELLKKRKALGLDLD